MIYGSIRVHTGPYGPIFVARGEKSQVKKVKINISDRDFFLGLFQGNVKYIYHICLHTVRKTIIKSLKTHRPGTLNPDSGSFFQGASF